MEKLKGYSFFIISPTMDKTLVKLGWKSKGVGAVRGGRGGCLWLPKLNYALPANSQQQIQRKLKKREKRKKLLSFPITFIYSLCLPFITLERGLQKKLLAMINNVGAAKKNGKLTKK